MKPLTLKFGMDQSLDAHIETSGEIVKVHLDKQVFEFNKQELLTSTIEVRRQGQSLLVAAPHLQRVFDIAAAAGKGGGRDAGHAQNQLMALFPGKVVKVHAKAGQSAEAGDLLLVMESMKMEYSYRSPAKILIEKVLVAEGQVLSKGEAFFAWKAAL